MTQTGGKRWGREITMAILFALIGGGIGLLAGQTEVGEQIRKSTTRTVGGAIARGASMSLRDQVILENPQIIQALERGGGFGGEMSQQIAMNMFSHDEKSVAEARERVRVE